MAGNGGGREFGEDAMGWVVCVVVCEDGLDGGVFEGEDELFLEVERRFRKVGQRL